MHELTIAMGILEQIQDQQSQQGFETVHRVDLVCGQHNCVSQTHLNFCFHALATDSPARDATLSLRRLYKPFFCPACATEFNDVSTQRTAIKKTCPQCGESGVLQNDQAIYVTKMEVT